MPIRIKPVHYLKPCLLDLASIKRVCELVKKHFPTATFFAQDEFWEIYHEKELTAFIEAMSFRAKLDCFLVEGYEKELGAVVIDEKTEYGSIRGFIHAPDKLIKSISIQFDQDKAIVKCDVPPDQLEWFEHFMIDLNKCLKSATFGQIFRLVDKLPYPYMLYH